MIDFDRAMANGHSWFHRTYPHLTQKTIAYFSFEFGLHSSLPIYSGGLGILAGDHAKEASDLGPPFAGVGFSYPPGLFQEAPAVARLAGGDLRADRSDQRAYSPGRGWEWRRIAYRRVDGRPNRPGARVAGPGGAGAALSDGHRRGRKRAVGSRAVGRLYGGDIQTRLRQEIVLGIGGLRALAALGIEPTVYHMNEGHSAFLAIERIRLLMQNHRLSFEEALEASRSNNVFTTHTAVPAGFDIFEPSLLYEYFHGYCERAGIPFDALLRIGRRRPDDGGERFSMAMSALNSSCYRNAVSRLHRHVSQEMFQDMWERLPTWEVPITSITNGVHLPSWVNGDLAALYDQYLQPDWQERHMDPRTWDTINDIPDAELWEAHRRRKRRLVQFVRERVHDFALQRKASAAEVRRLSEVLDPDAFTIGFARRFATYKRATLLFRDVNRLQRNLHHPDMPVQIVVAGKAHPADQGGKSSHSGHLPQGPRPGGLASGRDRLRRRLRDGARLIAGGRASMSG